MYYALEQTIKIIDSGSSQPGCSLSPLPAMTMLERTFSRNLLYLVSVTLHG